MRRGVGIGAFVEGWFDILINATVTLGALGINMGLFGAGVRLTGGELVLSILSVILITSLVFGLFDLYRPIPYVRATRILGDTAGAVVITYVGVLLAHIMILDGVQRRLLLFRVAVACIVSLTVLLIKKRLIMSFVRFSRRRGEKLKRVLLVGGGESASVFIREFERENRGGIEIIGAVADDGVSDLLCRTLGCFDDFAKVLEDARPDFAVFCFDGYGGGKVREMVRLCDEKCVKVYLLPSALGFLRSQEQIEYIGSLPIINLHSTPLDVPKNAMIKRTFDVVVSVLLIVVSSPIMLFVAIGVWISLGRPIFFKQERAGRMGRPFRMLKFRSMRNVQGEGSEWTTGVDVRKTRFGNFIRRYSLDELPQLFCVLSGSMSLVGPRPEQSALVERFKEEIPLYMVKHYVKPGITGLAQIKGLRGDTSLRERISEDISYIERWSLMLDIEILLKTPAKMLNKSEVYTDRGNNDEK